VMTSQADRWRFSGHRPASLLFQRGVQYACHDSAFTVQTHAGGQTTLAPRRSAHARRAGPRPCSGSTCVSREKEGLVGYLSTSASMYLQNVDTMMDAWMTYSNANSRCTLAVRCSVCATVNCRNALSTACERRVQGYDTARVQGIRVISPPPVSVAPGRLLGDCMACWLAQLAEVAC